MSDTQISDWLSIELETILNLLVFIIHRFIVQESQISLRLVNLFKSIFWK